MRHLRRTHPTPSLQLPNRNETRIERRRRTTRRRAIAAISLTRGLDRRSRRRPATKRPVVGVPNPLAHLSNASHRINRCLPMLLHPCLASLALHPPRPARRRRLNNGPYRCMSLRPFPMHCPQHPIPRPKPLPLLHTLGTNGQVGRAWSGRPKLAAGCVPTTTRRLRARPVPTRSIATQAAALRPARLTCPPIKPFARPLALCPAARRVTIVTVVVVIVAIARR